MKVQPAETTLFWIILSCVIGFIITILVIQAIDNRFSRDKKREK